MVDGSVDLLGREMVAHFEVWITIVLSLVMSLVRVEPKNILPYLLGFEVFL